MKINIQLQNNREIKCNQTVIGKTLENEATILHFDITEEMIDKNFYIEFEKADGTKFSTSTLIKHSTFVNDGENEKFIGGYVEYAIPNSLLDIVGVLKVEVVLRKENQVFKTYTLKFNILESINASDEIPNQYPDFVSEVQKVMDLIETTGDGTKYLSNDGTYKAGGSGGVSDYNNLENKPITYLNGSDETPIYFNTLETGKYLLNGQTQPYENADITIYANNYFVEVEKDDTEVNILFNNVSNKSIEQYHVMVDGSNYNHTSLQYDNLKPKETIITNSRTLVTTTLEDNYNFQISSNPTRITISFPETRENGFRCWLIFKTDDTVPTFSCDYDIKWHGDSVVDNVFTLNPNKSYTIEFWQDVNYFNAEVREV